MKVYLDYSIIEECGKFKSSGVSYTDYAKIPNKNHEIIKDLEAFKKILNMHSVTFLYSSIHKLESFKQTKPLLQKLVSRNNFVKVPAIGLRICMVDPKLPRDTIMKIEECQSYFASDIKRNGPNAENIKDRKNLKKRMRKRFFDSIHIGTAINAGADIFLTMDYRFKRSIEQNSKHRNFFANKIRIFTPSEFIQKVATTHNAG